MPIRTLDLHGIAHEEVESLIHSFINSHWRANEEFHIITGHSSKMKSIVRSVLRNYDLEIFAVDSKNPGYLKIQTWHEYE